jgi:prevent-host-death family protein
VVPIFSVQEAARRLSELVEQVLAGQEVLIASQDVPVVRLTPVAGDRPRRVIGSARGLVKIGDDFDAPIEDFAPYER